MSATTSGLPRLRRDQIHFHFDPQEEPRIRVASGARLVVETEDAHMGSIRTADDVYQTLAEVFEKLGGANPVTGPIYVEGVEPETASRSRSRRSSRGPSRGRATPC